jgi:hypothetical protein
MSDNDFARFADGATTATIGSMACSKTCNGNR